MVEPANSDGRDVEIIMFVVTLASAIWVCVDASRLGARRGRLGGGFFDMGPAGWFFAIALMWIVGFPAYLATRPRLVDAARTAAAGWYPPVGPDPRLIAPASAPAPPYPQAWTGGTSIPAQPGAPAQWAAPSAPPQWTAPPAAPSSPFEPPR